MPERLVNASIDLSSMTAGRLWADSVPMPKSTGLPDYAATRIRRSACLQWVIRMHDLNLDPKPKEALDLSAAEVCTIADAEFSRLQNCGVNVVTRGHTSSVLGRKVFTVTPWLEGLQPCPPVLFENAVRPLLRDYFQAPQELDPETVFMYLPAEEIAHPRQYSVLPTLVEGPFLHDNDTRLAY